MSPGPRGLMTSPHLQPCHDHAELHEATAPSRPASGAQASVTLLLLPHWEALRKSGWRPTNHRPTWGAGGAPGRQSLGDAGLLRGCPTADPDDAPLPRCPQKSVSAWSSPRPWIGPSDSS